MLEDFRTYQPNLYKFNMFTLFFLLVNIKLDNLLLFILLFSSSLNTSVCFLVHLESFMSV